MFTIIVFFAPPGGSGWIVGVGQLDNSSTASGRSEPARTVGPRVLLPYPLLSSYLLLLFLRFISFLLFPCSSVWGMGSMFPIAVLKGTCSFQRAHQIRCNYRHVAQCVL